MKQCRKPVAFADPKSLPYDVREHLLSDDARKLMTAFWQAISAPHMPTEVTVAQSVLCGCCARSPIRLGALGQTTRSCGSCATASPIDADRRRFCNH